jgi:hypothetical protein
MSRHQIVLRTGRYVICGFDRPFGTFFAQLYDPLDDPNDPPIKSIGYHPAERDPRERTSHGPYPVATAEQFNRALEAWSLDPRDRMAIVRAAGHDR